MGRKVFISFLGTNNYLQCIYSINGIASTPTRFVQEALIDHYCCEWSENDEIIVFGTGDNKEKKIIGSKTKNWLDNGQDRELENKSLENKGLYGILNAKNLKAKLNDITLIPEGFSEKEIWDIFNIVFEKLHQNDEIYFDVTHAFRSIPMFSTILINYARLLKNTNLVAIHYGAFEKLGSSFEVKNIPLGERIAPVLDLMPMVSLQDWTVAARNFIDYGKADKIHGLLEQKYNQLIINQESRNIDAQNLKNLDKKLLAFSESIVSNKIDDIIKGYDLNPNLIDVKKSEMVLAHAFTPLLDKIEEKIKGFQLNDLNNVFQATEWCIQHEMYQNAYSILLEGTISIILERVNEVYSGQSTFIESKRGTIIHTAQFFQGKKSKDECINSFRIAEKIKSDAGELHAVIGKIWDSLDIDLANTIVALNAKRNSYMHAGTGTNQLGSFQNLKKEIEKYCSFLKTHFQSKQSTKSRFRPMLINLSNHPASLWGEEQTKAAAEKYGAVIDLSFPVIDPEAETDAVALLAEQYEVKIRKLLATENAGAFAVHIMGELTFCFALVARLQKPGITCLASTTRRETIENGDGLKTSRFEFVRFREYARI